MNVIGVCYDVKSLYQFTSKKIGKLLKRRDVILFDESKQTIPVTFWNNDAENYNESKLRMVITILNGRINEYLGTKSIAIFQDTFVEFEQNTEAAVDLKNWFEHQNNILINDYNELNDTKYSTIADVFQTEIQFFFHHFYLDIALDSSRIFYQFITNQMHLSKC